MLTQVVPQAPQLERVFEVLVSQPFWALPSQLPKVPVQTGWQRPPEQLVVPFALEHPALHALQFPVLVFRFISHPFEARLSQLPKPALQLTVQLPLVHPAVAFVPLQTVPQEPQLDVLVFRFASQPFTAFESQLAKPELQTGWHAEPEQLVVPFRFVQELPHAPQLASVFVRFVSQPFRALPSQLPQFEVQVPSVQVPVPQLSAALARSQTVLQSPQSVSVAMLRSQPLFWFPSQLL